MTPNLGNHPEYYDEAIDVKRLNELLDAITAKRFIWPSIFVAAVRGACDLFGITLPHLEIEGTNGATPEESPFILNRATDPLNPNMYAAPEEGEYFFHVLDADGDTSMIYLYMVCDKDEEGVFECYAQLVNEEELYDVMNIADHRLYPEIEKEHTFIDNTRLARGDSIQDQDDTPPET